jgi:hypothetical protein
VARGGWMLERVAPRKCAGRPMGVASDLPAVIIDR